MKQRLKLALAAVWAKSKAVAMSLAVGASLSLPAFASEGGSGSGSSDLATVINATDTITTMMGKAWDMILANPITRVSASAGLLSIGIGFFVYLRRAARH